MVVAIKLFLSLAATIGGFLILVAIPYNDLDLFWDYGFEFTFGVALLAGGITALWWIRKSLKS